MLPTAHRITHGEDFRHAVRHGRRKASGHLVLHLAVSRPAGVEDAEPARVGFVVSRAVGNAVVRNRVKRRLRHLAREHLASLPGSGLLVVRALPTAATASHAELEQDLARGLARLAPERRGVGGA